MHHNWVKQDVGAADDSQTSKNAMQAQQTAQYTEDMSFVFDELGSSQSLGAPVFLISNIN